METPFFCRSCGSDHNDPADARLGRDVTCLDCAMSGEGAMPEIATDESLPAIAA